SRAKASGRPIVAPPPRAVKATKECDFPGCGKICVGQKAYCEGHRAQLSSGKELKPLRKAVTDGNGYRRLNRRRKHGRCEACTQADREYRQQYHRKYG